MFPSVILWYMTILLPSPTPTPSWVNSSLKKSARPVAWYVEITVVTSGFGICQTPENPDLGAQSPPSRCPGRPPTRSREQGDRGSRQLLGALLGTAQGSREPGSLLGCLPAPWAQEHLPSVRLQLTMETEEIQPQSWALAPPASGCGGFHQEGYVIHYQSICLDLGFHFLPLYEKSDHLYLEWQDFMSSVMAAPGSQLRVVQTLGVARCGDSRQPPLTSKSCPVQRDFLILGVNQQTQ